MRVTSGLIIDDPWIEYILNGTKDWEMRSTSTSKREWIGLIRKGTGQVHGIALLKGAGEPLSDKEMIATFAHHRIPATEIRSGKLSGWRIPWKLGEARRLAKPVPYRHKSGSVTWVRFSAAESEAIAGASAFDEEDGANLQAENQSELPPTPDREVKPHQDATGTIGTPVQRVAEITAGNRGNNHIRVAKFIDFFPKDVVGGSNKNARAPKLLTLEAEGLPSVQTDIAGDKKIFRDRRWTGAFFRRNEVGPGDKVSVTKLEPYRFRLDVIRRGG